MAQLDIEWPWKRRRAQSIEGAVAPRNQMPRGTLLLLSSSRQLMPLPFPIQSMKSLCVYCGSSIGTDPAYADAARRMAQTMVEENIALVYGGGNVGLMGVIADEVMRLGGQATGVIPQALMDKEVGHVGLTRLHVVKDMHERKALMAELSDGFVAMPGGIGTLEELFEVFTWSQLGFHDKPIGLLNVQGFYDGLIGFLQHVVDHGFLRQPTAATLLHAADAAALLRRLRAFRPQPQEKLLDPATAGKII
jgi:uncharacterized protein (TIGR00730 family)